MLGEPSMPERATGERRHVRRGETAAGPYALAVTPESAGWAFSGLRVLELAPGASHSLDTGADELVVLPFAGACTVTVDGERVRPRRPRRRVRRGQRPGLRAARRAGRDRLGARRALRAAQRARRAPARGRATSPPTTSPSSCAGRAPASRQINNFCGPDVSFADRLIAVEVLTPAGNWSSYPPHKHDEDVPGVETPLEEIYFFEVAAPRPGAPGLRLPARLRLGPRPRDRRHGRGARRRRDRHAARLPRSFDGGARVRPLLPQRDGRPRGARLALHRRPRPRVDPRHVGATRTSIPRLPMTAARRTRTA